MGNTLPGIVTIAFVKRVNLSVSIEYSMILLLFFLCTSQLGKINLFLDNVVQFDWSRQNLHPGNPLCQPLFVAEMFLNIFRAMEVCQKTIPPLS